MTKDRQNVLRSALNFVSGFSHVPPASLPDQSDLELEKDLNVGSTAPEMLYMLLPGSYCWGISPVVFVLLTPGIGINRFTCIRLSDTPLARSHYGIDAAEFGQAAVLANAFKCFRWNSNHQRMCLESARRALVVLLAMLERSDQQTDTADQYPSFLTW